MTRSRRQVRSLRVVAVTPLYPPASRVGAWLTTHEFLRHLAARGHRVDVYPFLSSDPPYELDGVNVYPRKVPADVALDGADVIVSHLGDNQIAATEAADRDIPSVRMVHGSSPDNAAKLAEHPTALAVFNSASLAAEVPHKCPSIVAHPPTNPAEYRTTPGTNVTLVNLADAKGGVLFWRLARSMPEVQFLGVRGSYGQQVSSKSKNATVIAATDDMAADVYARTRVLLIPSERETWGRVGLEAMASGIPVVAHPTPGLVESLGEAAMFVDRNDEQGWRTAITDLMRPSVWRAASTKARAHADRFDPAAQLAKFATAIEKIKAPA